MRFVLFFVMVAVAQSGDIRFKDVAAQAGLKFVLKNGAAGEYHQIELMPGGVAVLDYNNDGCMDIFFSNGATSPGLKKTGSEFSNHLYRNNCNGTFSDITQAAGIAGDGFSMGASAADYDNDGFTDLFVPGVYANHLYRNQGDGTFQDVTARAGLAGGDGKSWGISAGWMDVDNDGWLDLFVSNYVAWNGSAEKRCGTPRDPQYCHPDNYAARPGQLFHNNHDGTFTDISVASGVASAMGKGMGVTFADFNGDGLIDVFVANDSLRNFLFLNKGGSKFEEAGLTYGVAYGEEGRPVAGMGADFRDIDNDGRPDIALTGMFNDSYLVFHNAGPPFYFEDGTIKAGLALATRSLTGWSMGLFDFDNDGWKDAFFANSHFPQLAHFTGSPSPLPNSVFRNMNGRFVDASSTAGADIVAPGYYRGAAFADFDNDGRVDIVVTQIDGPARLYKNITETPGHWLAIKLTGKKSNRDGLGTKIEITLPDGTKQYNHATTSVGYASSSEPFVRFGLAGNREVKEIKLLWPSGIIQNLRNVRGDRLLKVTEPER